MLSSTLQSMRITPSRLSPPLPRCCAAPGHARRAGAGSQPDAAARQPAQQPPPAAPTQPVFRAGINTVRVDVIVTDRQGNPVTDLKPRTSKSSEDNKPQTVETFRLVKIDQTTVPAYTQRSLRTPQRRRDGGRRRELAHLRVLPGRLSRPRRTRACRCASRSSTSSPTSSAPSDLIGVMYPLTPIDAVVLTRNHQGVINTVEKFMGRKHDYEPMNDLERGYVYKLTPDAIEMMRRQVSLTRDPRHLHQAGIAARRPQVADPGERRLHGAAAAADAQRSAGRFRRSGRRHARSVCRRQQPAGRSRAVHRRTRHAARAAGRVRRRQSQQHVDLRASIRAGWRSATSTSPPNISMRTSQRSLSAGARHAADAGREHRRPRHRQSQRPGGAA